MGRRVAALAESDRRFAVAAGFDKGDDPAPRLKGADVLIDFSVPAASVRHCRLAARARKPIVVGTTGFSSRQMAAISRAARGTAVFLSPNFSPGMNVLARLAQEAAAALPGYAASILDVHHALKKDAPSGTARLLARSVRLGAPRMKISTVSQRLGTAIGDHALTLAGPFERIELVHRAESRDLFAKGALETALWVMGRKPGLYGMDDLLDHRR